MESEDIEEIVFCPIIKEPCIEGKCTWYMGAWEACAIVTISCDADTIAEFLKNWRTK